MPTYDYECKACGHTFEEVQRIVDDSLKECPKCSDSNGLKRLIGSPEFILKGGGWYRDGYSNSGDRDNE